MTASFDPLGAAREELAGLVDAQRVIAQKENRAEEMMGLAEQELNAIRKINGCLALAVAALQERIAKLENESAG